MGRAGSWCRRVVDPERVGELLELVIGDALEPADRVREGMVGPGGWRLGWWLFLWGVAPFVWVAAGEPPAGRAPVALGGFADQRHVSYLGLGDGLVDLGGELAVGQVGRFGAVGVAAFDPAVEGGGVIPAAGRRCEVVARPQRLEDQLLDLWCELLGRAIRSRRRVPVRRSKRSTITSQ